MSLMQKALRALEPRSEAVELQPEESPPERGSAAAPAEEPLSVTGGVDLAAIDLIEQGLRIVTEPWSPGGGDEPTATEHFASASREAESPPRRDPTEATRPSRELEPCSTPSVPREPNVRQIYQNAKGGGAALAESVEASESKPATPEPETPRPAALELETPRPLAAQPRAPRAESAIPKAASPKAAAPEPTAPLPVEVLSEEPAAVGVPPVARELVHPSPFELQVRSKLVNTEAGEPLRRGAAHIAASFPSEEGRSLAVFGVESDPRAHLIDTTAAIAMLLAAGGFGDVLLIDADLPHKELTEAMGHRGEPGLTEILSGRRNRRECRRATGEARLDFLPAGRAAPPDHATCLPALAELLRHFEREYAFVVTAAGIAGAQFGERVARVVDSTYLLVQLSATAIPDAEEACHRLRLVGARLSGCLVLQPAP